MTLSKRSLGLVATAAILSTFFSSAPANAGGQCWKYRAAERGFARKINSERGGNLGNLKLDPELSKAARVHTNEMIRNNELYHTPTTALTRRVTNWITLGENVGVGGTVSSLHQAFMASAGHRANVLHSPYKNVGIGTKHAHGRLWVTVIFQGAHNPGTTLNMPNC